MRTDCGCVKASLVAIYLFWAYTSLISINKLALRGFYNISMAGCLSSQQPAQLQTGLGAEFLKGQTRETNQDEAEEERGLVQAWQGKAGCLFAVWAPLSACYINIWLLQSPQVLLSCLSPAMSVRVGKEMDVVVLPFLCLYLPTFFPVSLELFPAHSTSLAVRLCNSAPAPHLHCTQLPSLPELALLPPTPKAHTFFPTPLEFLFFFQQKQRTTHFTSPQCDCDPLTFSFFLHHANTPCSSP